MGRNVISHQTELFGWAITVTARKLDQGWDVGVFGGCRTHVGAVTLSQPGGAVQTIELPGHKEQEITVPWATQFASELDEPICIRCGIHYDHIAPEEIQTVVNICNELLAETLWCIKEETS